MARPNEGSFRWPGRDRSAEIGRAAELAAERGLERLRERQRRRRPPAPPPPPPPVVPRALPEEAPEPDEPTAPDIWSAEFDRLAEELIDDLRRDLGPERA